MSISELYVFVVYGGSAGELWGAGMFVGAGVDMTVTHHVKLYGASSFICVCLRSSLPCCFHEVDCSKTPCTNVKNICVFALSRWGWWSWRCHWYGGFTISHSAGPKRSVEDQKTAAFIQQTAGLPGAMASTSCLWNFLNHCHQKHWNK